MQRQCPFDDLDLGGQPIIVQTGAASGHHGGRRPGHSGGDGAGGGGVADAHLSETEKIGAGGDFLLGHFESALDCRLRLLARHGGPDRHVLGATADLLQHKPLERAQFIGNAHVHHDHAGANVPRQDVDGSTAAQEVADHLRRDRLRVGADTLRHHAMIGGHHQDGRPAEDRAGGGADACDTDRQFLKSAQAAFRLGQGSLAKPGQSHSLTVEGREGGCEMLEPG